MARVEWVGHLKVATTRTGVIVVNTHKHFTKGHTHLNTMSEGKWIAVLAIKKEIPQRCRLRHLGSLKRLSKDKAYIEELDRLIDIREKKGLKGFANNDVVIKQV